MGFKGCLLQQGSFEKEPFQESIISRFFLETYSEKVLQNR